MSFADGSSLDTPSLDLIRNFEDLRKYRELLTDPDMTEKADQITELVREMLCMETDELVDFMEDKVVDFWPDEYDGLFVDDDQEGADEAAARLEQLERIVERAFRTLVNNRLRALVKNGYRKVLTDAPEA